MTPSILGAVSTYLVELCCALSCFFVVRYMTPPKERPAALRQTDRLERPFRPRRQGTEFIKLGLERVGAPSRLGPLPHTHRGFWHRVKTSEIACCATRKGDPLLSSSFFGVFFIFEISTLLSWERHTLAFALSSWS